MSKAINKEILMCPNCKHVKLNYDANKIVCNSCNSVYTQKSNRCICFVDYDESDVSDFIDKIKSKFKKFHVFYKLLIDIISPVCPVNNGLKRFIKKYVTRNDIVATNLGSGNSNLHENISNIDIFAYGNVNMTAELENLPIQDNTVDVILNTAVLEHIPFPEKAVSEFYRIMKKDGVIYCSFPFIQGFHASPYDFSRRSAEGVKVLFKDFKILEVKDATGPTSGFLWVFQEYFAILLLQFEFGSCALSARQKGSVPVS